MPAPIHVIFNGQLIPAAEAKVSPLSDGFMFGHGVFETIKARSGRALRLPAHLDRMQRSCAALGISGPEDAVFTARNITRLLAIAKLPNAAVKIMRWKELSGCSELITARPYPYQPTDYLRGFRLKTLTQHGRGSRMTMHKSFNYLENLYARQQARESGADEALFVTPERLVLEGSMSTLFIFKDGEVKTPSLSHGVLPGVMRAAVLNLLGGEHTHECDLTLDDVLDADEVFLTNALMGVMPVSEIEGRRYSSNAIFTARLRNALLDEETRELSALSAS